MSELKRAKAPGLFSSLRHRDYALFIGAFTTSSIGSWAYNVALVVWLIQETGEPAWIAAATVCRFVPALIFSAYGGVIAERFEQVRVMFVTDLVCAAAMAAMAVSMAMSAPPAIVLVLAAICSTAGTAYEPASAALTPRLVPERELGSANALRNTIDNVAVVAGPGVGAVLVLVAEPWVAVLANTVSFLASAALIRTIRTRSTPVDVTEGGQAGPLKQMLVGIRAIGTSPTAATLVAFCLVVTLVYGTDTVLYVVLSEEVLGTGAEGYGYLLAGLGIGGIAAAGLVTRLERRPRLGPVILLGVAGYCLPTLAFLVIDEPVVAFLLQCIRGAGTLVVDVLAITALQRTLPTELLGRVFGAFNALCLLAIMIGSTLMPIGIHLLGLDGVLWIVGLGIPLACLVGLPWLNRMDREARARRAELQPVLELLAACEVFASTSDGALDELAGATELVDVPEGTVMIRAGEPADSFYVVASGTYVATSGDAVLSTMTDGDHFGELGLIERVPRTATVTATTAGRLLRIDGAAFLTALTEIAPTAAFVDGARVRLSRTNPSTTMSRPWEPSDVADGR